MINRASQLMIAAGAFLGTGRGVGLRTAWSAPISLRAETRLAPCMARPNLFSGD